MEEGVPARRASPLPSIVLLVFCILSGRVAGETRFAGEIQNVTVTVGRDASLSCTVEDLKSHKVGWIHLKREMIVAVHTRMITRIDRYSVTHDDHKTWTLHLNNVKEEDRGYYMCQVNTEPAISQVGYLQVVVPPNILDEQSSKSEIQVREKSNVTMVCRGDGFPAPRIKWKREDEKMISSNNRNPVAQYNGETLKIFSVSRTDMGAYLCIASNGVPPSVSKRITLKVEFPPQIHVPNQLVGVPLGDNVTIECFVEAYPKAISYWQKGELMIMDNHKYKTETRKSLYRIHMKMTIFSFSRSDNTSYLCVAKNSLGETEGKIKLNEIYVPPKAKEIRSGESHTEEAIFGVPSTIEDTKESYDVLERDHEKVFQDITIPRSSFVEPDDLSSVSAVSLSTVTAVNFHLILMLPLMRVVG